MRTPAILTLLTLALSVTACAYYEDYGPGPYGAYGGYRYDGGDYGRRGGGMLRFGGRGGGLLDPWLGETEEGQTVVTLGFDEGRNGRISEETAHRANVWFRRYADTDRDMRLTDEEIRIGLVQASRPGMAGRY